MEREKPSSKGEWFASYFDDRMIHLYRARLDEADTRMEVAAMLEMLELPIGAPVLDVGCGWGRHSLLLAQAGLSVTGLDISSPALDLAEREARRTGVDARWVRGDMRRLDFDEEFDAALSLFSSLGYFLADEDDLAVLMGIHRSLRPGGRFLLETMHRDSLVSGYSTHERWDDHEGEPVEVLRSFDPVTGVNRERLIWPDGSTREHAMRVRTVTEWVELFRRAGFEIETLEGGWQGERLAAESPILLALARKPG